MSCASCQRVSIHPEVPESSFLLNMIRAYISKRRGVTAHPTTPCFENPFDFHFRVRVGVRVWVRVWVRARVRVEL